MDFGKGYGLPLDLPPDPLTTVQFKVMKKSAYFTCQEKGIRVTAGLLVVVSAFCTRGESLETATKAPPKVQAAKVVVVKPDAQALAAAQVRRSQIGNSMLAAQKAYIDERTGQLREGTPEDAALAAELQPLLIRDTANTPTILHPNGMRSAVLDHGFLNASIARKVPGGHIIQSCVSQARQLNSTTTTAVEATAKKVEVTHEK